MKLTHLQIPTDVNSLPSAVRLCYCALCWTEGACTLTFGSQIWFLIKSDKK